MKNPLNDYLQAYLDDELNPQMRRLVESYLAREPEARRELEEMRECSRLLKAWKDVSPSADFRTRVGAAIRGQPAGQGASPPLQGRQSASPAEGRPGPSPRLLRFPHRAGAKPHRTAWQWARALRAVAATAAVVLIMVVCSRLFYSRGEADDRRALVAWMSRLAGQVTSVEELADMDLVVETATLGVMADDRPDQPASTLAETAQLVTAYAQRPLDQRLDLRDLLAALANRHAVQTAAASGSSAAWAEDSPLLPPRAAWQAALDLERQGEFAAAASRYEEVVPATTSQRVRLLMRQAYCELRRGRGDQARHHLRQLESVPGGSRLYKALAGHLVAVLAEIDEAGRIVEQLAAQSLDPAASPDTLRTLARAQMVARRYAEASANLKAYARLTPNREEQSVALVKAAWCLRLAGRHDQAHQQLESALAAAPAEADGLAAWIRFHQACAHLRRSDLQQGLAILDVLHQGAASSSEAERSVRAAALFLAGYLRIYGSSSRAASHAARQEATERFEPLINLYPETTYAQIARGYLGSPVQKDSKAGDSPHSP